MELFIWSCSTEANHWIKTSSGVTCRSYPSVQLPDIFPENHTFGKQRFAFSFGDVCISCCHFSLAPEAGCCDSKAYPHCWKWHWQIMTCQSIWQHQHNFLTHTHAPVCARAHTCAQTKTQDLFFHHSADVTRFHLIPSTCALFPIHLKHFKGEFWYS